MFNIIVLGLVSLLTDVSSEMVYPLLPLFLTSARIGATPAIVGLIEGLAESLASLLKVFSGAWSDRVQQRKPLAMAGYGASAVGKVILCLAGSWPVVLIARLGDRFGKGIRTAPRDALIADSTDASQRGNAFGLHRALDSSGACIGVVIAFVFLATAQGDVTTIFMLSVIPAILGVILLGFVRETRPAAPVAAVAGAGDGPVHKPAREHWWHNIGARWNTLDRKLKLFLVVVFIFALGNSSNEFLLLRGKDLGYDNTTVLLLYLVYNVVYTLVSWPAGRWSDRVGRKRLLVLGYIAYGLVYFGFAVASREALWVLFAIYGVYIAFTEGIEKAFVADIAPKAQRATLIGLHATFTGIGLLPASFAAGLLWDAFGPAATFYFGGGMGLLAALAFWLVM